MALGSALALKHKARIRMRKATVLIGVIDESDTLEDGEIFV